MNTDTVKTPLDICNMALAKLGESPINEINYFGSPAERLCDIHYHPTRREVLCANRWPFATRTDTIECTEKNYRGDTPHTLPLDALRVLEVSAPNWTLRGRTIWCPEQKINIIYIADEVETALFSPIFIEAFATRLAAKICKPLIHSVMKAEQLTNAYQKLI